MQPPVETQSQTDSLSPLVPILSLSLFAVASGFLMSLIPLALKSHGMPESLASWLASIFYAGLLAGSFISAKIVSRLYHRLSLIIFLLVIAASILTMLGFANPLVWLFSRFIAGIAIAGVFVAIESWLLIADSEKMRAKRLGMYMTALYGGAALGQLGIGLFGTDTQTSMLMISALMISAALPPLLIKKGLPPVLAHSSINLKELRLVPVAAYIGCIISGLLIGAIYGLLPLELNFSFSLDKVGSLMAVVVLGGMLVQPLVSFLNARLEKAFLMALFALLGILAIAVIEVATAIVGTLLGLFLLGAATFALYPIGITLACQKLCKTKIIAATELMLLSYSIGSVIGPMLAGKSLSHLGSLMPYLLLCFSLTLIYMLVAAKRTRNRLKATQIESSLTS